MGIADLPNPENLSGVTSKHEIFVIDGKAFVPSETDPEWVNNPIDTEYMNTFSNQTHNFCGFTTWLDILPAGSLQSAGSETQGGFSTNKYTIKGTVSDQSIMGTLWFDDSTHALVKAEIHVPNTLNSDPENQESGETVIQLDAEIKEVDPVTLPAQ